MNNERIGDPRYAYPRPEDLPHPPESDTRRASIIVEWTSGPWDAYVQRMVERHADQMMTNLVNQGVADPSISGALNEDGSLPIGPDVD